jgi:hypothetical protein
METLHKPFLLRPRSRNAVTLFTCLAYPKATLRQARYKISLAAAAVHSHPFVLTSAFASHPRSFSILSLPAQHGEKRNRDWRDGCRFRRRRATARSHPLWPQCWKARNSPSFDERQTQFHGLAFDPPGTKEHRSVAHPTTSIQDHVRSQHARLRGHMSSANSVQVHTTSNTAIASRRPRSRRRKRAKLRPRGRTSVRTSDAHHARRNY